MRDKVGDWLEDASLVVATGTVAGTAWFLGGAIPHARLLLLSGAIAATVIGQVGRFLKRRSTDVRSHRTSAEAATDEQPVQRATGRVPNIPRCLWPLLGFVVLCIIQLLPVYSPSILQINHATHSELLAGIRSEWTLPEREPGTVMPSETRLHLAQFLAFALLATTIWQGTSGLRQIRIVLGIIAANGCLMSVLALGQTFGAKTVVIGNHWKVSNSTPFACFVNPNNAAGWFLVCMVCAFVLAALQFEKAATPESRYAAMLGKRWWRDLVSHVANLNISQVLCVATVVLLIAAATATLSRGGIVATVLTLLVILFSRTRRGGWLVFLAGFLVLVVLAVGAVALFDLDTFVIKELQTLKDPVSESTSRFLHWSDTLPIVADFPLLGSGMGSYRYSTLPYQKHYWGTWFQRADNQFVEVLVEGGIIGFLLIVLTGGTVIYQAARICFSHRRKKTGPDVVSWLASGTLAMFLGIGSASLLDYGISLPSVSGVIVVLWILFDRMTHVSEASKLVTSHWQVSLTAWLMCLAGLPMLTDLYHAGKVYEASAESQRFLSLPTSDVAYTAERLNQLSEALTSALTHRPDDLEGQRISNQMRQVQWQEFCFQTLVMKHGVKPESRGSMVPQLTFATLAEQQSQLKDLERAQLLALMASVSSEVPWEQETLALQKSFPWMPDVNYGLSLYRLASGRKLRTETVQMIQLMDPGAAREAYILGSLLRKFGEADLSQGLWQQCLAVSERFRPEILLESTGGSDFESALSEYVPNDYEGCIACAERLVSKPELQQRVLEKAEALWPAWSEPLTPQKALTRSRQLMLLDPQKSIAWLNEVLGEWPDDLQLRITKARQLEQVGRNNEAYDEWLTILTQHPGNEDAEKAMERLIKLPDTDPNPKRQ